MDRSSSRYAYRCLPLGIANSYGWQLQVDAPFRVSWDGGSGAGAVKVESDGGAHVPISFFGEGTFTFHVGYVFRTDYPYGLYVTGSPNFPKANVVPLSGIVETFWLPFPFTMNWKFTQPGMVEFAAGDVFCHFFPVDVEAFGNITPEIRSMSEDPELEAEYELWSQSRSEFSALLASDDYRGVGWQKFYTRGKYPERGVLECPADGGRVESRHVSRLRVPEFRRDL